MQRIKSVFKNNKNIILNILGAFIIKGGSMLLTLFLLPAYMRFFGNQNVLGIWYTMLSVLHWVLMFDLGVGNGLRNKLPAALASNDYKSAKKYIASTYISVFAFVIIIGVVGTIAINLLNWNSILGIEESELSSEFLKRALRIAFLGIMIQFELKLITSILYAVQKSAIVNLLPLISNIIIFISLNMLPSGAPQDNLITMSLINVCAVNIPLFITTIILFAGKLKPLRPKIRDFSMTATKQILKIGIAILWLQLVFMIISSTNEFLISAFCSPGDVVEYQVYFKIFNSIASICSLALIPIWSAVTKAQAENRYKWISNTYKLLLVCTVIVLIIGIIVSFVLQPIVNIWLKENAIQIKLIYAIIFSISSWIFLVHNVNTSIGNGMSYFKPQMIFMTLAAIIDIPLAWLFVDLFGGWIGIVIANIVALLPFEIVQPIKLRIKLKEICTD